MSKHIHKLKRAKYKTGTYYFYCTGAQCHYKIDKEVAFGKETICWRCGKPFELNSYSLKLNKPHCSDCHLSKTSIKDKNNEPISIDQILPGIDDAIFNSTTNDEQKNESKPKLQMPDSIGIKFVERRKEKIVTSLQERLKNSTFSGQLLDSNDEDIEL